jgi:hypothetical protein
MNYAYLLSRLPDQVRSRMERETIYAPWLQRGGDLEALLTDSAVMETVWNRLFPAEKGVLQLIVKHFGCEPFDAIGLERAAAGLLAGAEAKAGLTSLLQKGIVFAFRKSWGEHVYVMPDDGLRLWQQMLFPPLEDQPTDDPCIQVTLSAGTSLAQELFYLLVQSAQQGLKLTKGGTLHKKQLQKLADMLRLQEAWLSGASLKYAFSDMYPLPLAIGLDLLLRLQLAEQRQDEIVLDEAACSRWLHLSPEEQDAILYACWKSLTRPSEAALQHGVILMERQPAQAWISWKSMEQWLARCGIAREQLRETWERSWALPLIAFGWLEQGVDAAGECYYRWLRNPAGKSDTPAEEEGPALIVQPDFDLLVPPDVPQSVVWELCSFADSVVRDRLSVFKLSKESLRRGLECGRTCDEMLDFLERHAMYGVPENVRLTLIQWTKPYGKVRYEQVILLRCADPETAESLQRLTSVAGKLEERIGEKDFLIRPESVRALTEALEKAGWMPGKVSGLPGTEPEGRNYPRLAAADDKGKMTLPWIAGDKGLIYSRHSTQYFEMERRLPELYELYPDLNSIPPMWLKDYRSYHPSTRKEMVEKAIEWKTMLQLRRNGTDYRVAPRKLQETRGTWCMTGRERPVGQQQAEELPLEEVQWLAEDWQEMKLILPGVNDKF